VTDIPSPADRMLAAAYQLRRETPGPLTLAVADWLEATAAVAVVDLPAAGGVVVCRRCGQPPGGGCCSPWAEALTVAEIVTGEG
jgi:hypothetical protein